MKLPLYLKTIATFLLILLLSSCASKWKVQGGPKSCKKMCRNWGLDFTAMVGVGNQDNTGPGATACVCQPKKYTKSAALHGSSSSSASLAGPIVAAQAAAAAAAQQQAMMAAQQARAAQAR